MIKTWMTMTAASIFVFGCKSGSPSSTTLSGAMSNHVVDCATDGVTNAAFEIHHLQFGTGLQGALTGIGPAYMGCDPGAATLLWTCQEKLSPAVKHTGLYRIEVTNERGIVHATITNPDTKENIQLSPCTVRADKAETPPAVRPTYAQVKDIIEKNCVKCHQQHDSLATLEGMSKARGGIYETLKVGGMPFRNRIWKDTDDGKLLLSWLKWGAEFPAPLQ